MAQARAKRLPEPLQKQRRIPRVFAFLELQEWLALSRGYCGDASWGAGARFHFDPAGSWGGLRGKGRRASTWRLARRGGLEAQQLAGRHQCHPSRAPACHHPAGHGLGLEHELTGRRRCRLGCCCRCTTSWCLEGRRRRRWKRPAGPSPVAPCRAGACSCWWPLRWTRGWAPQLGWRAEQPA